MATVTEGKNFVIAALELASDIMAEINHILNNVYDTCEYQQKLFNESNQ